MSQSGEPRGTIVRALRAHLPDQDHRAALWLGPGACVTYREMFDLVEQLAVVLHQQGIHSTSRIAFATPRGAPAVVGFLAASSVGTCCPLDGKLKQSEFCEAFAALAPDILLSIDDDSPGVRAAECAGVPVIHFHVDPLRKTCAAHPMECSVQNQAGEPRVPALLAGREAPAILMRTSGTTADPKLVGLSHSNVLAATAVMVNVFTLGRDDVCITPMPLHHVHGLIAGALSALAAGSSIHCCESFSPEAFDSALRTYSPTWFTAAPALHLAMCDYYESKKTRPHAPRLRRFRSSSAPLASASIQRLESLFGAPLIETYGLTETASTICSNLLPPGKRKPGSVGVPIDAELLILTDEDIPAQTGTNGEILLRGPGVIREYLGTQPPGAFFDGWLRTGDVGHLDDDGYLYVVGRKKELIKRGGHSVFPLEIDDALSSEPGVAEAVTFSIPHDTLGEDVLAAVVTKTGMAVDADALRERLAQSLSTYKVPTRILIVDSIPRNAIGKVLRRELPRLLASRLAAEGRGPDSDVERKLLDIWHALLRRHDIGVTDNVFQFGADPLRAELAASAILRETGIEISVKIIFAHPTVRAQASLTEATKE